VTEDAHAHTSYSDGAGLPRMVDAAANAGLDAIGFTDHCGVGRARREERLLWNRNFDQTYERRREALAVAADRAPELTVYDGVEMDYAPEAAATIESFLETAGFDYAIGSIHYVDGRHAFPFEDFGDASNEERDAFVDAYYDAVVSLAESELFDVLGHVDLIEDHPALRGRTTESHRRRVAAACAETGTVPEINAGRTGDRGEFDDLHPALPFVETFRDHGVGFVVGTDAHAPDDFTGRLDRLDRFLETTGIEPLSLSAVVGEAASQ